jgi:hypothetical protein
VVWPANIWQKTFQCMDAASFETILDQANITNITYWDLNLTNKPRSFNWQIEHDRTNQDWGYDLGSPLEMSLRWGSSSQGRKSLRISCCNKNHV